MRDFKNIKRFLSNRDYRIKNPVHDTVISRYIGLCCLGIKENFERAGFYRKAIRELFNDINSICYTRYSDNKFTEEDLDNLIDFITEKPTVVALIIKCEDEIIKYLNPTAEEIEESKPYL